MESTRRLPKKIIHMTQEMSAQFTYTHCKCSAVAAFIENKISML